MTDHALVDSGFPLGLVGGIGLTEVHVYAQRPTPDGALSCCPHVHAVTAEGYYVLRGAGAVEFHDLEHGFRTLELRTGQYVHFPSWVMHRLISDGSLVILGIMANAGLAERGEARIYFGAEVDADPARFEELMSLPRRRGLDGALERRDAAVRGYQSLMRLWHEDRPGYFAELRRFFNFHAHAMSARKEELLTFVQRGPQAWSEQTVRHLQALPSIETSAAPVQLNRTGTDSGLGMCGVLRPILSLQSF